MLAVYHHLKVEGVRGGINIAPGFLLSLPAKLYCCLCYNPPLGGMLELPQCGQACNFAKLSMLKLSPQR